MGYAIDWSDLEQRIQDQKAALLDTSQNMDPERLKFLVETYDECKGESVFITRAKLFEKVLNNKKINALSTGKIRAIGDILYFVTLQEENAK